MDFRQIQGWSRNRRNRHNQYNDRVAPAAIDLDLDGEGFNAIDGGGKNAGQHRQILGEGGRKGNAVFVSLIDAVLEKIAFFTVTLICGRDGRWLNCSQMPTRSDSQFNLKWKDTPIWLRLVMIVAITNFASFMVVSISRGGDALNGKEEGGRYFINSHGHYTEVSKAFFTYSSIHARSLFITDPAAIFAFAWFFIRRRPVIRPVPAGGTVVMNVQFAERGGTRLDGFNATWPFATLSADSQALKLKCLRVEYVFHKNSIRRLSKHKALFSAGLRIEHTEPSFPPFVVFWTFDFRKLKAQLEGLNYEISQ